MTNLSGIAPEFEAMQESALKKVREMTDEDLQKYAKLMVSRGTPSAGTRGYGFERILTKGGETAASERAKYGVMGLEFGESKRRFGETMGFEREKFGEEKRLKEREYSLFEQQLKDLREARKKEQKNWWKKYLGTALGTGLGMLLPGVGNVIGAEIGGLFSGSGSSGLSEASGYDWDTGKYIGGDSGMVKL